MDEWIKVSAPGTVANVGPGFDIFGIALHEPCDIIEGRKIDASKGIVISEITGPGSDSITKDPKRNCATIALAEVLKRASADFGVEVKIHKGIRPCSGVGSSGASSGGGAYLGHILTGEKLSMTDIVYCAAIGEGGNSGACHADNVAPCVLGGFTIVHSYDPFEVISIRPPKNLGLVIALPDVIVPTSQSRAVLPKQVDLKDMVFHVGNAASLVHAMHTGDIDLIGRSIRDAVIEPARAHLVPHLREAEKIAIDNGAVASCIGGSGPCIISFFKRSEMDGKAIADAIKKFYIENGMQCDTWVTVCGAGCRRI